MVVSRSTSPAALPDGSRPVAIAHRHGNLPDLLTAAADAQVDVLETDVYAWGRRLEVRHGRVVGPLLLDGWRLSRRPRDPLTLEQVLAALPPSLVLMLDLKGWRPWTGHRVRQVMERAAPGRPYVVCGRSWRMLAAFDACPEAVVVWSAATRRELHRLRARLRLAPAWGVSVKRPLLQEPVTRELRERARLVMTWPVDTAQQREAALAIGVNGVISDDLQVLAALRAQ